MKTNDLITRQRTLKNIKFCFDEKIKQNFYTTEYFLTSKKILNNKLHSSITTMQFACFGQDQFMMCGGYEVIALLKFYLTDEQLKRTELYILEEGAIADKQTPLVVIKGYYPDFMCLENIIDGILSRRCSVATNCFYAQQALLEHQKIIYMADRNCDYFNQSFDAYPAYLAGIDLFVTEAQIALIKDDQNVKAIGTMPHALIQQYNNDLNKLIKDFSSINNTKNIFCLLDYENNVLKTLEDILPTFNLLAGVRLDTSESLTDASLTNTNLNGVNPTLVNLVKNWLVCHNLDDKKIVVTSKITPEKIRNINCQTSSVDYYGIGSHFLTNSVHVSADLVEVNGKHQAKFGKKLLKNFTKLTKVAWN